MPQERRQDILEILENSSKPVKGGELAELLGVSRQVIVQDIALLRAHGQGIIATPQGYFIIKEDNSSVSRVFACIHDFRGMEKELKIMVSKGGKVLDVIVEHPLYGEINANLMLKSMDDVDQFINNLKSSGAEPLAVLTKGIHLHTVEAASQGILDKIERELQKEALLV